MVLADVSIVYREYDCMDPLARAPTPLPPMFLYNDEDDDSQVEVSNTETTNPHDRGLAITPTERALPEPATPLPTLETSQSTALLTNVPRTPGSIRRFAINLLNKPKQSKAAPQERPEVEPQVEHESPGAPEGTKLGSEPGEVVEVLHRSYEYCDGPKPPPKRESSSMQMPNTPPASPKKMSSVLQDTSPASTMSTLSPVPSNLSDNDKQEGIKVSSLTVRKDCTANLDRSKAHLLYKAFQASLLRQRREKAPPLAVLHERSPRRPKRHLRASPVHRSGRRIASRSSRCKSCIQEHFCVRAALGSLLGRRNEKEIEACGAI